MSQLYNNYGANLSRMPKEDVLVSGERYSTESHFIRVLVHIAQVPPLGRKFQGGLLAGEQKFGDEELLHQTLFSALNVPWPNFLRETSDA